MTGDGIDMLEGRRRQRRTPLPPQHPRSADAAPAIPTEGAEQAAPDDAAAETAPVAEPQQPATPAVRTELGRQRPSLQEPAAPEPVRLVQVYLPANVDAFLREVRSIALMRNVDVSGSAVVRHAMDQLMRQTNARELVDQLGEPKGKSHARRGRPRRS
jgi:hypothetical protein